MTCRFVVDGDCRLLKKKCDNCIANRPDFEKAMKDAVLLRACGFLGDYVGSSRCNCASNKLTHWFICNKRKDKVSAEKCINCFDTGKNL